MALTSSLSSKGQITLPIEIRKRLGLKTGDRVEFVIEGDRTSVRPARGAEENPFLAYVGISDVHKSQHEVNDWVARLRDE